MLILLGVSGCSPMPRPEWLPDARQLNHWPYGSAVVVTPRDWYAKRVAGELIAIAPDSIWVLTPSGLRAMAYHEAKRIEVRANSEGTLKDEVSIKPRPSAKETELVSSRIRTFARFPGGLPDSLDRAALRLPPRDHGPGTFLNP